VPVNPQQQRDARTVFAAQDAQRAREVQGPSAAQPTPPAQPAVGPGATDVGNMRPGELDALRRSSNPLDRRRADTIARAQTAYADHMARGGRVIVSASQGNGGHPVVTLLPPGFDPNKPARVQTHYHGFHATVADGRNHSSGTTRRIDELQARDPQLVVVLPEASNAPARGGNYATNWNNVRSQAQTTRDALAAAGVNDANITHRTVSAHSGGGAALARAMQSQRDGSGVQADRLELADSLYGSESAVAAWARTPAGRAAQDVTYLHGTNRAGRDRAIRDAFGDRYRRVSVPGPDAHNRAVYGYLGG
jgi:hypothetical protein